jgi:Ca2+-binding EF-hand superfamily protein
LLFSKVVFFWILLVRHIMLYLNNNPDQIPKFKSEAWVSANSKSLQGHIELSVQEQQQIKDIFDLFDTDGGGSIDSEEMDAAMFALGFQPLSGRNRDEISSQAQESKQVTLKDFTSMMKGELMIASPLDTIWAAFASLSRESNCDQVQAPTKPAACEELGTVTLEGLRRACREFDVLMNDAELQDMMGTVDMDSNGSVDREEFMRIMHHAPWF